MITDPDIWPVHCALCDRGFHPHNASHLCDNCNRELDDED